jgi:hypothetical protein
VARLEQRQQRPGALDRLADLLPVRGGPGGARSGRAQAGLAGGQVEQRHGRLDQHVVDADALHLLLELTQLFL